jgi:hypothetical protein
MNAPVDGAFRNSHRVAGVPRRMLACFGRLPWIQYSAVRGFAGQYLPVPGIVMDSTAGSSTQRFSAAGCRVGDGQATTAPGRGLKRFRRLSEARGRRGVIPDRRCFNTSRPNTPAPPGDTRAARLACASADSLQGQYLRQAPGSRPRHRQHRQRQRGLAHAEGGRQVEHLRNHRQRRTSCGGAERRSDRRCKRWPIQERASCAAVGGWHQPLSFSPYPCCLTDFRPAWTTCRSSPPCP